MAKFQINDTEIEGEPCEFEVARDAWQVLELPDGVRLRLKQVVRSVYRNKAVADARQPHAYLVVSQMIAFVEPKDEDSPEGAKLDARVSEG